MKILSPMGAIHAMTRQRQAMCAVAMQAEQDYTVLRDLLKAGKFEKADDETRALLIRLAGPDAVARNWVYFTEVIYSCSLRPALSMIPSARWESQFQSAHNFRSRGHWNGCPAGRISLFATERFLKYCC